MSQATGISATGQTGGTCQASGPYKCTTHPSVVMFFKSGDKFTACPSSSSRSGHETTWTLLIGDRSVPLYPLYLLQSLLVLAPRPFGVS
jgi:hypothetical protein